MMTHYLIIIITLPFYQEKVFLAGVTAAKTKKKGDFNVETSSSNFHWKCFCLILLSNAGTNGDENLSIEAITNDIGKVRAYITDTTDENASNQCENTFNESNQQKMETGRVGTVVWMWKLKNLLGRWSPIKSISRIYGGAHAVYD